MKGTLTKTEQGWVVNWDNPLRLYQDQHILHPEDINDSLIEGKEVDFEIIEINWGGVIQAFAKLNFKKQIKFKDRELALFLRWILKNYSTSTINGMFGYVDSMGREVDIETIIDHYKSETI